MVGGAFWIGDSWTTQKISSRFSHGTLPCLLQVLGLGQPIVVVYWGAFLPQFGKLMRFQRAQYKPSPVAPTSTLVKAHSVLSVGLHPRAIAWAASKWCCFVTFRNQNRRTLQTFDHSSRASYPSLSTTALCALTLFVWSYSFVPLLMVIVAAKWQVCAHAMPSHPLPQSRHCCSQFHPLQQPFHSVAHSSVVKSSSSVAVLATTVCFVSKFTDATLWQAWLFFDHLLQKLFLRGVQEYF